MTITAPKFPETEAEVQANRERAVRALLNDDGTQCRGDLFKGGDQEARCALGVLVSEFWGIRTLEDYRRALEQRIICDGYSDLERLLGVGEHWARYVWRMNDFDRMSFAEIGGQLAADWSAG